MRHRYTFNVVFQTVAEDEEKARDNIDFALHFIDGDDPQIVKVEIAGDEDRT